MRIGIDLGGTKIEGVLLDGERTVARERVPTPQQDHAGTLRAIVDLVGRLEATAGAGPARVGLGHPGSLIPGTGRLRNANSTWLNGQALQRDLEAALDRPLRLANDANCLALSEAHDGAARGAETAFLVILGTGVGGALLVRGGLISGANALAGEWGHTPLPWATDQDPQRPCWCGLTGCLETLLSGPGLAQDHQEATGRVLPAADIAAAAAAGEAAAQDTLERYRGRLARALALVINFFDPQRIVLAGGLSGLQCLYREVPALWIRWVFAQSVTTELIPARHGDASGVFGAARLWDDH